MAQLLANVLVNKIELQTDKVIIKIPELIKTLRVDVPQHIFIRCDILMEISAASNREFISDSWLRSYSFPSMRLLY